MTTWLLALIALLLVFVAIQWAEIRLLRRRVDEQDAHGRKRHVSAW